MVNKKINSSSVSCDGDDDIGHPKVYLEIDPAIGKIECPYCSKDFILDKK